MSTVFQATTQVALEKKQLCGEPPVPLRRLIDNLFANGLDEGGLSVTSIKATQIPADVLSQLNEFAASVAQKTNCTIVSIHQCSSCYVGNVPGNLATTEDGWEQCWKCEPNV